MKTSTTVTVAFAMISLAFAGCIGGGELDMLVTPPESDPVTEAFIFEATGPKYEVYSWEFGDGVRMEGQEVEHIYGFTDGDIIVRLTASNAGEDPVTIARTVPLGGGRNVNPEGVMTTSAYWVDPGEVFSISSAGSTDSNGDPLLYRWTCERQGPLVSPDTSHPPHSGLGGVPFGVDAWATENSNLTGGTDFGSTLCADLDSNEVRPWNTQDDAITGSITESGTYVFELFVRDPKGSPWIGRVNMYVSEPDRLKPVGPFNLNVQGTFNGGGGGQFQSIYNGETNEQIPGLSSVAGEQTFDVLQVPFSVDIHSKSGQLTFTYEGGTAQEQGSTAQYRVYPAASPGNNAIQTSSSDRTISLGELKSNPDGTPQDYVVEITVEPFGTQVEVEFDLTFDYDLAPYHWYEPATA